MTGVIDRLGAAAPVTREHGRSAISQWWLVAVLGAAIMLGYIDKNILALLVAPIKADIGLSDTQMSVVLGLSFGAAYTLASLPAGVLADRLERRIIIACGLVLWCVMTAICGLATTFSGLLLTRALVGLAEGMIVPAAASMIREGVDPDRRGRAYSVMVMAPLVGGGIAILGGGGLVAAASAHGAFQIPWIGELQPWQLILFALGVGGLLFAPLLFTTYEPPRERKVRAVEGSFSQAIQHIVRNWPLYAPLFVLSIMNGVVISIFGAWTPTLLGRSFGLGPAEIGRTLGVGILIGPPVGLIMAGALMDRVRRRAPLSGPALLAIIGAGIVGATASMAPLVENQGQFWIVFGVQLLLSGVPGVAAQVILANATPADQMGKIQGIYMLFTGLAGLAVGPTLAAWAGDAFFAGPRSLNHGISVVCGIAQGLAVVAALFIYRSARRMQWETR